LSEIREDLGVGGAGDEGLEHDPAGGPEEAAGDRGELDAGVFSRPEPSVPGFTSNRAPESQVATAGRSDHVVTFTE